MATYVSTVRFTEQGIQDIKDTTRRAAAMKAAAKRMGLKVREVFWVMGSIDGLLIFEAPDEQAATALMLDICALGNVRTETMRAFSASEMDRILARKRG
jgi:uncharacterized protein with GYD domain